MGLVVKTPGGKYVKQVKASVLSDWKCVTYNIEEAKIFRDVVAVNKYFAFMIGYFTKWQPESVRENVARLMEYEIVPVRVVENEYAHSSKTSTLKVFEKVLLERLENI